MVQSVSRLEMYINRVGCWRVSVNKRSKHIKFRLRGSPDCGVPVLHTERGPRVRGRRS